VLWITRWLHLPPIKMTELALVKAPTQAHRSDGWQNSLLTFAAPVAGVEDSEQGKTAAKTGHKPLFAVKIALLQQLEAKPPPIDPVAIDQPVPDLHHLNEVHLLAVRLRAWIFPHQRTPVGEEPFAIPLTRRRLVRKDHLHEFPQLFPSGDDAFRRAQQMPDERRLQDAIRGI
jgi:hypothetical protein